jgi:NADH dehydrogenase FAD-containing subunit
MAWNVVILGGGFAGCTPRASWSAPPLHAAKVTIVTDVNFMLYAAAPGAAAGR